MNAALEQTCLLTRPANLNAINDLVLSSSANYIEAIIC